MRIYVIINIYIKIKRIVGNGGFTDGFRFWHWLFILKTIY